MKYYTRYIQIEIQLQNYSSDLGFASSFDFDLIFFLRLSFFPPFVFFSFNFFLIFVLSTFRFFSAFDNFFFSFFTFFSPSSLSSSVSSFSTIHLRSQVPHLNCHSVCSVILFSSDVSSLAVQMQNVVLASVHNSEGFSCPISWV